MSALVGTTAEAGSGGADAGTPGVGVRAVRVGVAGAGYDDTGVVGS